MPPKLPTRQLGKDGPQVTALGFGAMGLSAFYGPPGNDEERLAFLDHVYESGELNWDSADVYGDSEDLIGKWFARSGKRSEIFLATKFASTTDENGNRVIKSDPEYCKQACAKSLKRLGIDQIDLYYCHRVDGKTPIEKTVRTFLEIPSFKG
jgi:aryl-alcohol dehydrogenase-like predicted oxidoreductase